MLFKKGGDSNMVNRLVLVLMTFALVGTMLTQAAYAHDNSGNDKPGWGHGDKNHHHTGPPGHSVRPGDGHHHFHWKNNQFFWFLFHWPFGDH